MRAPLAALAPPDSDKPKPKPIPTDISCDECGETMVIRTGRSGPFLGCSKYPKCKSNKPLPEGVTGETSVRSPSAAFLVLVAAAARASVVAADSERLAVYWRR